MDSPEDENSLQCENFLGCDKPKCSGIDAGVQLDDLTENGLESEDSAQSISNDIVNIDMKHPLAIQNCIAPGVQVSSELVVITNTANFLSDPKIPVAPLQDVNGPLSKRICIEQDGQTYILAIPDGMDCSNGLLELRQKSLPTFGTAQLVNPQEITGLTTKQGVNQNWFTSREEKATLHNKGHMWKQGMWSKEEVDLLRSNIQQYCEERDIDDPATIIFEMSKDERKDFYRTVARGLNRPLFSVYRRLIRMYDNKNHVGKYSPEELAQLKKLRSVYGNDWQAIGTAMGRSASSIKDRCRLMKDNCNQGKWLPAEERRLAEAVYELTNALPGEMISSGLSWAIVAERVSTRSEKQCRTKWLNYLNWKEAGGTDWTREDDVTLICRVYALNVTDENQVDWAELAKGWSSVRSPQWLRGKWWNLRRHVPDNIKVSFQDVCEFLYQHFVQKIRVKDEAPECSSPVNHQVDNLSLQRSPLLTRPKPTILRTVDLPPTPPQPGIVVTAAPPACAAPDVSLTSATAVEVTPSGTTLPSMRMGSVLQTVEVLPQNIQLAANPQTFLLATHPQPAIPLTTSLSPSQIIIQTLPPENLHRNENVTVQMNAPQIIINASNPTALTSLASTQIPSAPPSPTNVDTDCLQNPHSALMDDGSYASQTIDESEEEIHEVSEINDVQPVESACQSNESSLLILSDPMLAASHSPDPGTSDMESEKNHVCDDSLEHVSTSDG